MDSLEVNKGIAAVLVAGIAFMGATMLSDALVHPVLLEKLAIAIKGAPAAGGPAEIPDPPVEQLLQTADPAKGQADTQRLCVSCHSFNEGGHALVGPNLYGVVGGPHAHMPGYAYSAAIKAKTGPWTFDELYQWLKKPSAYAPGTKMSFAGDSDPKQRADIIDYLRTLSPTPLPLPPPPAAAAPAATAASAAAAAKPGPAPAPGAKAPGLATPGGAAPAPASAPGAAAASQGQGQQQTQPSANQNQTQVQQTQSQQPPQAKPVSPAPGAGVAKPAESQKN